MWRCTPCKTELLEAQAGALGLPLWRIPIFRGCRARVPHDGVSAYPERIVCLTEETTETLYLLGQGHRVVGVSGYTVRPPEARAKPKVSAFINARFDKIEALRPDLVLAFSDLQAYILQPGPASLTEGVRQLHAHFARVHEQRP